MHDGVSSASDGDSSHMGLGPHASWPHLTLVTPLKSPSTFVLGVKASTYEIQGDTVQSIAEVCAEEDPEAASRLTRKKSTTNQQHLSRETDVHATGTVVLIHLVSHLPWLRWKYPTKHSCFPARTMCQIPCRQLLLPFIEPSEAGAVIALIGHCGN